MLKSRKRLISILVVVAIMLSATTVALAANANVVVARAPYGADLYSEPDYNSLLVAMLDNGDTLYRQHTTTNWAQGYVYAYSQIKTLTDMSGNRPIAIGFWGYIDNVQLNSL
jgi:hypothetical protein